MNGLLGSFPHPHHVFREAAFFAGTVPGLTFSATSTPGSSFTFTQLKEALPAFESSDAQDSLQRWNLLPFMRTAAFRFDQPFTPEQTDAFLIDFFGAAAVQEAAPVCTSPGQWGPLGSLGPGAVKYGRLPTTVLRLDFFDRLKDAGIVRMGDIANAVMVVPNLLALVLLSGVVFALSRGDKTAGKDFHAETPEEPEEY